MRYADVTIEGFACGRAFLPVEAPTRDVPDRLALEAGALLSVDVVDAAMDEAAVFPGRPWQERSLLVATEVGRALFGRRDEPFEKALLEAWVRNGRSRLVVDLRSEMEALASRLVLGGPR